jgi:hypothetical protein
MDFEEVGREVTEVLYRYIPGGSEENKEILRIAGVASYIRSEYFPDTGLERYR